MILLVYLPVNEYYAVNVHSEVNYLCAHMSSALSNVSLSNQECIPFETTFS